MFTKKSSGSTLTEKKEKSSNSLQTSKTPNTRIIVKFDAGFNNTLYLRGNGANLSWTKGIPLKNVKADEWIWETNSPFENCEFKVLLNDNQYEKGENHRLVHGANVQYTPSF